jgi:nicotinamide-nucleotide adenylyltransferase
VTDISDQAELLARLDDRDRWLALRQAVRRGAADPNPLVQLITATDLSDVRVLGLLPGSFNPPTLAHLGLAQAAIERGAAEVGLLTLSTHTVDKERITGAILEDRLLLLEQLCSRDPRLGVLLVNRGLYFEQAELVRLALPHVDRVVFLLGFDKIVQIFDARYYADREAALERLFSLADIVVAPRGAAGSEEVEALLDRPENRRFRHAVRPLDLPRYLRHVSSSDARARAGTGGSLDQLPPTVRVFVEVSGAYDESDAGRSRYDRRIEAMERSDESLSRPC